MVTDMPLTFNRNFQGLLVTVPGATRPHREHSAFFNSQDSLSTEVNGQSRLANNTMIEGVDDNQKTGLLQVIIPAADALETVSVIDQQLRRGVRPLGRRDHQRHAQVGHQRPQGQRRSSSATTRRPTPSDYFTHLKAPTKFVNGGFTLGGPIVRNKLFFFGDYQRTIDNLGYVVRATVPTLAMRNGDFSAVAQHIYDPLTGDVSGTNRVAFANNQIPQDRISPIAQQADRRSSRCRTSPARRSARTTIQQAQTREKTTDGFDAKVNYTLSAKDQMSYRVELHAAGRVRPGPVRRVRRPGQRRLRRHRHEHQLQHRRDLDARVQPSRRCSTCAAG